MNNLLLVALGGSIGAVFRYLISIFMIQVFGSSFLLVHCWLMSSVHFNGRNLRTGANESYQPRTQSADRYRPVGRFDNVFDFL